MSQIGKLINPTGSTTQTLTGDSGGAVGPDGAGNINVFGGNNCTTSGNPGTNTITIDVDDTLADTYDADSGSAIPALGVLEILGTGGLTTTGAGNTITIDSDGTIATQYDTDSGSAAPAADVIEILGAGGITTSGAGNTVTVTAGATLPTSFTSDSGSATPAANNLNVFGGTLISTSGASDTLTINADAAVSASFPTDSGTATPIANALQILGGTGISTSGATNVVTIDASTDVATTYTCDSGSATPSSNNLNVVGTGGITTSGSGSTVTIDGSAFGFTWVEETGTTASFVSNQGVIANNGTGITVTLPAASAVGDVIRIAGVGAGGWTIDQGTGQSINYLGTTTTTTSGTLSGDEINACLELLCIVANTTWLGLSSTGNFTIT